MKTTLNKIRSFSPCSTGWTKLLSTLNKTKADNEELDLLTILDSNGLDDTLWCLRAVDGYDKEKRLFAVFCAKQVEHLLTDERSEEAIRVAEQFANGKATEEELKVAYVAAYSAAYKAAHAAAAAAADAAADAADAAADAAAYAAAYAAADAAVRAAAYAAADAAQEAELRHILSIS